MLRARRKVGRRRRHPETRWRGLPSFISTAFFSCPYAGGAKRIASDAITPVRLHKLSVVYWFESRPQRREEMPQIDK